MKNTHNLIEKLAAAPAEWKHKIMLSLIICVGLIIRLSIINREVGFDEALSIYIARQPLGGLLNFALRSWEMSPPFYHLLIKVLLCISSSAVWLRMFSLACGLLVIFMTYKVGKLLFDKSTGLLSCALVAFSTSFIYYSVEIRAYSFYVLCSVLSIYFFLRLIGTFSKKYIVLYVVFLTLAIYSHYYGIFLLFGTFLFLALHKKLFPGDFKLWCIVLASICILLIPEAVYGFIKARRFMLLGEYYINRKLSINDISDLFSCYSGNWIVFLVYILAVVIGIRSKLKNSLSNLGLAQDRRLILGNYKARFLLIQLLLPITIVFIVSLTRYSIFQEFRFFIPFFIFYYVIIARCCLFYRGRFRKWLAILLVLLMFASAVRDCIILRKKPHGRYEKIAKLLKPKLHPSDVLAVTNIYDSLQIFNYLNRTIKFIVDSEEMKKFYILKAMDFNDDEAIKDIAQLISVNRLWLILEKGSVLPVWFKNNNQIKLSENIEIEKTKIQLYSIYH